MAMATAKPRSANAVDALSRLASRAPILGERQQAFRRPGDLHVSGEPCQIRTILGSCASICLWDKRQRAGGMNHFLLPASSGREPASLRFADMATKVLLEKLLLLGCRVRNLQAKIFGGSSMLQSQNRYASSLGAQNVAAALDLMKNESIPVIVQEPGGAQGRRIVLNTDEGTAWSRRI